MNTQTAAEYWARYHVDGPDDGFESIAASLDHFDWRNRAHPGYLETMPVDGADGKIVLDYGCGPGNDVIGFGTFSRPARLYAADVSSLALSLAARRAQLHGIEVEFLKIQESPVHVPLADASVNLIHSSGVLMMLPNPVAVLQEFRRIVQPGGYAQVMVYHRDSLWLHLYVAYVKQIVEGRWSDMEKKAAFQRSTDGEDCPISTCWSFDEMAAIAEQAGFACEDAGVSMSTTELKIMNDRWAAIEDQRLDPESRRFLSELTLDHRGFPVYRGRVAGINLACRLRPV